MSLQDAVLVFLVVLLSVTRGCTGQLNDLPPDCESGMDNIKKCIQSAVDAASATECNWYRLIGPLDDCVRDAVAGCNYEEQEVWYEYVRSYNKTMTMDDCYPACTNQETRSQRMFQCFNDADFERLVSEMQSEQELQSSDPSCRILYSMTTCLLSATSGCPALTDITHDRIYNMPNSADIFSKCGIAPFQAATTNAPVALLDTNSMMADPQSTTKSPGALSEGETLLVILGSIIILATIVVIIIVIIVTIRRSRDAHRRSILRDWRPNGQKVYIDEPQFLPAQSSSLYRPITISHNSGFLDETAHTP